MINKYVNKNYINNASDILSFYNDKEFKELLSLLDKNKKIKVTSHLIHKENYINQIEQFIFNLDNYISFIKNHVLIKPLEVRYLINLTIYNKYNICLYSDHYYYSSIEYYNNEFIKMFMNNYKENISKLSSILKIKEKSFNELVNIINNKKRTFIYFEDLSKYSESYYMTILKNLENIN